MAYARHPLAAARMRSAIVLVKAILSMRDPDILPVHRRELLTVLLWKVTEAESSKYKTRFQSKSAFACADRKQLRHEHVFQRAKMIDELLEAMPSEIERLLTKATGCIVTLEESHQLAKQDIHYGWERYRRAGIVVLDTAHDPPVEINESRWAL